jgi:hypothetical protein
MMTRDTIAPSVHAGRKSGMVGYNGAPATSTRFRQEAQLVSSLNHPHIVTIHDVGAFEGHPYIVTELIEGGTLRDWLKEQRDWRATVLRCIGCRRAARHRARSAAAISTQRPAADSAGGGEHRASEQSDVTVRVRFRTGRRDGIGRHERPHNRRFCSSQRQSIGLGSSCHAGADRNRRSHLVVTCSGRG